MPDMEHLGPVEGDPEGRQWVRGVDGTVLPVRPEEMQGLGLALQQDYAGLRPEQPPMGGYGASEPVAQLMSGDPSEAMSQVPEEAPPPANANMSAPGGAVQAPPPQRPAQSRPGVSLYTGQQQPATAGIDYQSADAATTRAGQNGMLAAGWTAEADAQGNLVWLPPMITSGGTRRRSEGVRESVALTPEGQIAANEADKLNPQLREAERSAGEATLDVGMEQATGYGRVAQEVQRHADDMAREYEETQARVAQVHERMNQDIIRYASREVNPNRMFDSNGGAGRVMAAVGVALGTLGAAMTGRPNDAMEIINRAVDRDIEAQRLEAQRGEAGLQAAQNLYSAMLGNIGDDRAAAQAVRATQLVAIENQIAQMIKGATVAADQEKLELLLLEVQQRRLQEQAMVGATITRHVTTTTPVSRHRQRLSLSEAMNPNVQQGLRAAGGSPASPEELRERAEATGEPIRIGNFRATAPLTDGQVAQASGFMRDYAPLDVAYQDMLSLISDRDRATNGNLRNRIGALAEEIQSRRSVAFGQGGMTEAERESARFSQIANRFNLGEWSGSSTREGDLAYIREVLGRARRQARATMHQYNMVEDENPVNFGTPTSRAPLPRVQEAQSPERAQTPSARQPSGRTPYQR